MMTMFHSYRGSQAVLVSEEGTTILVPESTLSAAGLIALRTGQRLVVSFDERGDVSAVALP